ncbi:MAG: LPS export ABC transporter periplasmic protein LptC [Gammaproteobacteria bacterium]|nr:LPS export ABC transporter periplasmic protein LptC [Gammaproteobacteria bacterium]
MKQRALAATVIFALVIGGVWFFSTQMSDNRSDPTAEDLQDEPVIRIGKVEMLEYGDDGSLQFKALASAMEHSQQEDIVTLDDIDLHIELEGGVIWNLTASKAIIKNATSESEPSERPRIDLIGEVNVVNERNQKLALSLSGQDLVYYPDERTLESQRSVTIQNELATFKASSFEFDLKTNEFQLIGSKTHRVEIEYAPDNSQQ